MAPLKSLNPFHMSGCLPICINRQSYSKSSLEHHFEIDLNFNHSVVIIWKLTVEVTIYVFLAKIRKFMYRYCTGVPNVGMSARIELQKNLKIKI